MLKFISSLRIAGTFRVCSLFAVTVFSCNVGRAVEQSSTLLLYNMNDPDSIAIRDHYLQTYPLVRTFGLDLVGLGEQISGDTYLTSIRTPVLNELTSQSWGEEIDTFVTTKGLPLRIDVGWSNALNWKRYSSLESELTRIDMIDSTQVMGDQVIGLAFLDIPGEVSANPYYLGLEFDFLGSPLPYPAPMGFDRSAPVNEGIRLAARLDGYSVQDVIDIIDRAQSAYVWPTQHTVIVDDDPTAAATLEDAMDRLSQQVLPSLGQVFDYNNSTTSITAAAGPVIGYTGHGTHAGLPFGEPGNLRDTGYINTALDFDLANGAVFHSYESFNAITFDPNSTAQQSAQGQVGQWIAIGGTAALGHVQEPGASKWSITNEDVFFDMLLNGYTFVESAWAATRQLSYVNTVIGDPLMRLQTLLPGDTNLDGTVEFNDFYTLDGNWLQPGTFEDGDFNGDGIVDEDDFEILQQNWLSTVGLLPSSDTEITVSPVLDSETGSPQLSATLVSPTNLNQDLNVDGEDLALLMASYGVDTGGDADGDGDTDGADFLLWQQHFYRYTLTADFDIDAYVGAVDLELWENSYAKNRGGDADGDYDTDGFDFLAWQREATVYSDPITAAVAHVPEPCGMLLFCAGVFLLAPSSLAIRSRRPSAR